MTLAELLAGVPSPRVRGDAGLAIGEVRDDSRQVRPGDVFVAIPGTLADGRRFLADAATRGAAALVVEDTDAGIGEEPGREFPGTVVVVPDARRALASIASRRWGGTAGLTLSAVTGTNGKTTTTYLMESILAAAGIRAGVIGTIAYRVGGGARGGGGQNDGGGERPPWSRAAPLTTPGALEIHALFAEMRATGATDVVLEATSHALVQRRLDGCVFRVAGLTNLTRDHLDYHGTMERYLDAKALLFEERLDAAGGVAVLPVDRPEGRALRARIPPGRVVLGIAVSRPETAGVPADVVVESFVSTPRGLRARLATPVGHPDVVSALVGDFNLANVTLAVGMAIARGLPAEAIGRGIERLAGVPGRLERVANARGVLTVVDYAHTPDALERALSVLRPLVTGGAGRLITVFGCGGDRDRGKRPVMGETAARDSDLAVITSDNPRGEDPLTIVDAIVAGAERAGQPALEAAALATAPRGFHVEPDRRAAIRAAVAASRAGDVLLIAGKGHEDYQIIAGRRTHFDDREEAAAAFAAAGAPGEPG